MIEYANVRRKVHYFTMIDDDPIVQWMDGNIFQAVYDPSIHFVANEQDLMRMSRDIERRYHNNMFSFQHVCRMAGGAK